ncbi:hypothetical protein [Simplicispira psychrophila]|uniref:hypothetical protein n=1 Tax=Simplicispira psychrophila TaxID=80882 RepID=UPI0012EC886F|nr:hypothetical protein [Simplicispira psychrophila]
MPPRFSALCTHHPGGDPGFIFIFSKSRHALQASGAFADQVEECFSDNLLAQKSFQAVLILTASVITRLNHFLMRKKSAAMPGSLVSKRISIVRGRLGGVSRWSVGVCRIKIVSDGVPSCIAYFARKFCIQPLRRQT